MADRSEDKIDILFRKIASLVRQGDGRDPSNPLVGLLTFEQYNALRVSKSREPPLAANGAVASLPQQPS
jgi:hypothetical protein